MDFWISDAGVIHVGDCLPGDRRATEYEVAEWELTRTAGMLAAYRASVAELLRETDVAAIRFFKAGLPFPQEWVAYVAALRVAYRVGDLGAVTPDRPALPLGV